jgi:hypothetical protein
LFSKKNSPDFDCGDGEGMDMQLNNKVYNKLKLHSTAENRRHQKIHEKKEHSTTVSHVNCIVTCITKELHISGVNTILLYFVNFHVLKKYIFMLKTIFCFQKKNFLLSILQL